MPDMQPKGSIRKKRSLYLVHSLILTFPLDSKLNLIGKETLKLTAIFDFRNTYNDSPQIDSFLIMSLSDTLLLHLYPETHCQRDIETLASMSLFTSDTPQNTSQLEFPSRP